MSFPFHHRRSQSEVHFRIPDDFDLQLDPFDAPSLHFQDPVPSHHDDLLSAYIDSDNSGSNVQPSATAPKPEDAGDGTCNTSSSKTGRAGHRRSNSVDGSSSSLMEGIEAKKAMPPDKLAELWTVDPKRAKRILANRQSAARSKERKAGYVSELERKIQTLQTEATTLSAQLNLFQRDTNGLCSENTELKLRLQSMEQQAKLCDALNEALKKEVDRLKMATGETVMHADTYSFGMHQFSYSPTPFFSHQPQQWPGRLHTMQMPQMHALSSNMSTPHRPMLDPATTYDLSEMLPSDSIGQFQGLDISHGASHNLMPDSPSISVNKINNAF
ncbi:putative transcription factor bZIP family [Lupinus albus]|uniref:Putative transcription factor bZIP family n=1 Tax=Lupinus albus TaxID=3870 RepID=A0A6A4PS44_LUPAL|nr:putative transcription factor bZIP family [Lupinus albus]